MVKFPEAHERMYKNMFVCRKCKSRQRSPPQKVLQKKISCRKCGCKALRPVRKK